MWAECGRRNSENGVLMDEEVGFTGPASERVRTIGKFLRSGAGWGMSMAEGRIPGAGYLDIENQLASYHGH